MSDMLNKESKSELPETKEIKSESSSENNLTESKPKRPNKTQKKFAKYQRRLENYKIRKANKKQNKIQKALENVLDENKLRKETNVILDETTKEPELTEKVKHNFESFINKRELKKRTNERLARVYENQGVGSLKVCIDCSFSDKMSQKEQSKLAQQIGRCYATNKAIEKPVHLTLCNLNKDSKFYSELVRLHDGFERYSILITDQSIDNHYSTKLDSVCYLSPDSKDHLEDVIDDNIYVIGGLVDETVNKKVTLDKCNNLKIKSYSLPIDKYMRRKVMPNKDFNYNKILAINQVFDILAYFYINKNWAESLDKSIPKRKGFEIGENNSNS